jgi:hypothetical protein
MTIKYDLERRIEIAIGNLGLTPPQHGDTNAMALERIALALEALVERYGIAPDEPQQSYETHPLYFERNYRGD